MYISASHNNVICCSGFSQIVCCITGCVRLVQIWQHLAGFAKLQTPLSILCRSWLCSQLHTSLSDGWEVLQWEESSGLWHRPVWYWNLYLLDAFFCCHSYCTFPSLSFSAKSFHPLKPNFTSSSGSGIGTFILAPAVQLLIENYSWRGALLILGGFVSNLCVCGALMRPLEPRQKER